MPEPLPSRRRSLALLDLTIAATCLAFVSCLLFGFVASINAHIALRRVEGQPYRAATFMVGRPYYQKSPGMHGSYVALYASGTVEGKKEWMDLRPYLKSAPRDQEELNALVPTGTSIPVYLFPNLKGRSRIHFDDSLPPGEASRRDEAWVLTRAPIALAGIGMLTFGLVRLRRSLASRRS